MATYRVELRSSADRELSRLGRQVVERLIQAIDAVGEQPRPVGLRKLAGAEHTYRIRLGEYRAVYTIDDACQLVSLSATGAMHSDECSRSKPCHLSEQSLSLFVSLLVRRSNVVRFGGSHGRRLSLGSVVSPG